MILIMCLAGRALPFATGVADFIHTEDFIAQLDPLPLLGFLRECRRILKPAGAMRMLTPDLARFARTYLEDPDHLVKGQVRVDAPDGFISNVRLAFKRRGRQQCIFPAIELDGPVAPPSNNVRGKRGVRFHPSSPEVKRNQPVIFEEVAAAHGPDDPLRQ